MTAEEIIQAISDDQMMPFIQPEQLAQIVAFVINNYQPSLPDNLDEAAKDIVIKMHPCLKDCAILGDRLTRGQLMALVKAGAEWMAKQGVILNLSIDELSCGAYNACVEQGLTSEDDVIIQVRKKEENHD